MKRIILNDQSEIEGYIELINHSVEEAHLRVTEIGESASPIEFLERLKFEKTGFDPLDSQRDINFFEQLNQTFTYLASFKAAEYLFENHDGINELVLNLGTSPGSDIETIDCGGIACEVFAATKPNSNNKLNKDIDKVVSTNAKHKYVFFMCPEIERGRYNQKINKDIIVWSLGL